MNTPTKSQLCRPAPPNTSKRMPPVSTEWTSGLTAATTDQPIPTYNISETAFGGPAGMNCNTMPSTARPQTTPKNPHPQGCAG